MLEGALIGLVVGLVIAFIKKNKHKKAIESITNSDMLDTPEYTAYFHHSLEPMFKGKGLRFFDSNGVGYISGNTFNYKTKDTTDSFDLTQCKIQNAGKKKKLDWIEIEQNGTKHYFTSFKQGAFKLDDSEMENFIAKLKERNLLVG